MSRLNFIMCVLGYACGAQKTTSAVILQEWSILLLRRGLSLLGSLQSARLAGQSTPGICLSLPQQIQCYKDTVTCREFYMSSDSFYSGSHGWIGGTLLPESCPCVPQFTFPLLLWEEGLHPLRINILELWAETLLASRYTTWWHRVKVTNCKRPQGNSLDNCFELGLPVSWTVWNKSLLLQLPNLADFAPITWYI